MRSKKGDDSGERFLLYIGYSVLILGGFVVFVGTISSFSDRSALVPEGIEDTLILQRVFSSPECFAYQDETGRAYDIIDLNKFSNENLKNCLQLGNYPYDFKFELAPLTSVSTLIPGGEDSSGVGVSRTVEDSDEETSTPLDPFTAHTQNWFGHHFEERYAIPVLVRNNSKNIPLQVYITKQKSTRTYS